MSAPDATLTVSDGALALGVTDDVVRMTVSYGIPAGGVTTAQLADGAVTAPKLDVALAYDVADGDLTITMT